MGMGVVTEPSTTPVITMQLVGALLLTAGLVLSDSFDEAFNELKGDFGNFGNFDNFGLKSDNKKEESKKEAQEISSIYTFWWSRSRNWCCLLTGSHSSICPCSGSLFPCSCSLCSCSPCIS